MSGSNVLGVKVLGVKEGIAAIAAAQARTEGALVISLKAGALIVQNAAKVLAPYKTGNLRRSIHTEVISASPTNALVSVGTDVVYAAAQEFDHDTPYLRPALDENATAVTEAIRLALARSLGVV